jgi:hypothetical protein
MWYTGLTLLEKVKHDGSNTALVSPLNEYRLRAMVFILGRIGTYVETQLLSTAQPASLHGATITAL